MDVLGQSLAFIPTPKSPSDCQLLCVFYAEFDIIVGPKICFQYPQRFLDQDITISPKEIDECLANSFEQSANDNSDISQSCVQPDHHRNIPRVAASSLSIFDSISEFIIPGNELADRIISLSTHSFHILTRATIIYNARYQRNSLLFSVGFVIRRAIDPYPFRSLLARLSSTLRVMEIETQYLTKSGTRIEIEKTLRGVLYSLNNEHECNLVLDDANVLNLKLFKTPSGSLSSVPDYVVPILLRPDWQVLSFDWDLTISWIVPWVDGCKNIRLISQASSVDVEMVRASIQVLQYHGVVAIVDQFWYSNIYECTQLAAQMLAGNQPKLLDAMYRFVCDEGKPYETQSDNATQIKARGVNTMLQHQRVCSISSKRSLGTSLDIFSDNISSFNDGPSLFFPSHETFDDDTRAYPSVHNGCDMKVELVSTALSVVYCSFRRHLSFGEILLSRILSSKVVALDDDESRASSICTASLHETSSCASEDDEETIKSLDWLRLFESFDHRRFITFGVVFGLIQRVHQYPLVAEIDNDSEDTLISRVAKCMDGSKSDDELSCIFEMPFADLLSLVQCTGNRDILLCYSMR